MKSFLTIITTEEPIYSMGIYTGYAEILQGPSKLFNSFFSIFRIVVTIFIFFISVFVYFYSIFIYRIFGNIMPFLIFFYSVPILFKILKVFLNRVKTKSKVPSFTSRTFNIITSYCFSSYLLWFRFCCSLYFFFNTLYNLINFILSIIKMTS